MRRKKAVVALSGGVDSSLAAVLLKENGYDVIGITMDVFNRRSSWGRKTLADAAGAAASLNIPHFVVNLEKEFHERVIADFCSEYAKGRTPNPCIRCNRFIKFEALWKEANKLNADYLSTGHHARIMEKKPGRYLLLKGKDQEKDQSYFLYTLTQQQLSRTLFPIGNYTKREVRKLARQKNLPVHQRPESQDICFIPDNDYISFLRKRIPMVFRTGPIVDLNNRTLGQHEGIIHFTIGQRKGMGLASPDPVYVLEIHPEKNQIVVGRDEFLFKKKLIVSGINLIDADDRREPIPVKAKIRYKHREAKALLTILDEKKACLRFEKSQRAVTPGQSAVFYDGDVVIGGGIIEGECV